MQERLSLNNLYFELLSKFHSLSFSGAQSVSIPSMKLNAFPELYLQRQIRHTDLSQLYVLPTGQLLTKVLLQEELRCLNLNGEEVWNSCKISKSTCLAHHGNIIYCIRYSISGACTIIHYTDYHNLRKGRETVLFRHYAPKSYITWDILADSHHLVVVQQCDEHTTTKPSKLLIHNFTSQSKQYIQADICVRSACFHADGDMLILTPNDSLYKYKINSMNLTISKQWQCSGLTGSLSVCSAAGITYVGAEDCIYVISMFGELNI